MLTVTVLSFEYVVLKGLVI